jgi:hypothetical protein
MPQFLIRYRTKPEQAAANEELVRAVFAELNDAQPDGLSYATFKLADQVTFVHLVQADQMPSPLVAVKAFGEFQAGIAARCEHLPVREELTPIGTYRLLTPVRHGPR